MRKTYSKPIVLTVIAALGIVFGLSACSDMPNVKSLTYFSYDRYGTSTLVLENGEGDHGDVLLTSIRGYDGNEKEQSFEVAPTALEDAFVLCSGYTMWDEHVGDIDSRCGKLVIAFSDGTTREFDVTNPIEGDESLGQADKAASHLVHLSQEASWQ